MKHIIFYLVAIISLGLNIEAAGYDISPSLRFTLERENRASPLVYYFTSPDVSNQSYPILVLCDGSDSKGNLRSVLFIREYFAERICALNVGYLTVEKWGIDGNEINEKEFWTHYTRSAHFS
jgi:hypothetical protein